MERYGLLLLRLALGGGLASHGYAKIFGADGVEGFATYLGEAGFPMADILAWVAAVTELGGGLLVVVGLITRVAAFFCFGAMAVAVFFVHWGDTFADMEKAVLYMAGFFALVLLGPGSLAVMPAKDKDESDAET